MNEKCNKKKKKDKRKRVGFSPDEYQLLEEKAIANNRAIKDLILDCTLGFEYVADTSREFVEVHKDVLELKDEVHAILLLFIDEIEYVPGSFNDVVAKMDDIIRLEKLIYRRLKKQKGETI